jgi:hypothetical protein
MVFSRARLDRQNSGVLQMFLEHVGKKDGVDRAARGTDAA